MLSSRRHSIAYQIGVGTAFSHFIMFLNPANRGPLFKWDNLPELAAKMAKGQVGLAGDFKRDEKTMQGIAAAAAKATIERCFKESNIKNWINEV